jgi:hypothetical protein
MPSTGTDRSVTRRVARRVGGVLLTIGLASAAAACSLLEDEPSRPAPGTARADVVDEVQALLRQRARALRTQDLDAFLGTVSDEGPAFVRRERTYFANLGQLPVGTLRFTVDPSTLVRDGDGYDVVARVALRLDGYDAAPVVRPARFRVVDDPDGPGLLVASDRDRPWERRNGVDVQPWDEGRVVVRRGRGVLGIFDETSDRVSARVIREVERGIDAVSTTIPYDWDGHVVVYALSDTRLLDGLDGIPGGDPDAVDAVAFPVTAREGEPALAGTRFLLHPRMLSSDPARLARLIRHELTHIALGERDDRVPVWLSEGLAEWVSVQPIAPGRRLIGAAAIEAARAGPSELPEDTTFNGPDQGAHYGLSWWACQAIVDMYGEQMLWRLLDDLAATDEANQADELQQVLQMGTGQLAREAARRILATYD